jgi:hypothetical protein
VLAPTVTVPTNSATPYLRSRFTVLDDGLHVDVPRTAIGLVSLGRLRRHLSFDRLADVRVGMALLPLRAIAVVALATTAALVPGLARWAAVLLALWLVPLSYVAVVKVSTVDGRRWRHPICLFYRFDLGLLVAAVHQERRQRVGAADGRTHGPATDRDPKDSRSPTAGGDDGHR